MSVIELNIISTLEGGGFTELSKSLGQGMAFSNDFEANFRFMKDSASDFKDQFEVLSSDIKLSKENVQDISNAFNAISNQDMSMEGVNKMNEAYNYMLQQIGILQEQNGQYSERISKLGEALTNIVSNKIELLESDIKAFYDKYISNVELINEASENNLYLTGEQGREVERLISRYGGLLSVLQKNGDELANNILQVEDNRLKAEQLDKQWADVNKRVAVLGGPILAGFTNQVRELVKQSNDVWGLITQLSDYLSKGFIPAIQMSMGYAEEYRFTFNRLSGSVQKLVKFQAQLSNELGGTTEQSVAAIKATVELRRAINSVSDSTQEAGQAFEDLARSNLMVVNSTGLSSQAVGEFQKALVGSTNSIEAAVHASNLLIARSRQLGLTQDSLQRVMQYTNRNAFLMAALFDKTEKAALDYAEGLMMIEAAASSAGVSSEVFNEMFTKAVTDPLDNVILLGDKLGDFMKGDGDPTQRMLQFSESANKAYEALEKQPAGIRNLLAQELYGQTIDQLKQASEMYNELYDDTGRLRDGAADKLEKEKAANEALKAYKESIRTVYQQWQKLLNALQPALVSAMQLVESVLIPVLETLAGFLNSGVGQAIVYIGLATIAFTKLVGIAQGLILALKFIIPGFAAAGGAAQSFTTSVSAALKSLTPMIPTMLAVAGSMLMMSIAAVALASAMYIVFTMFNENAFAAAAALGAMVLVMYSMVPLVGALGAVSAAAVGPILALGGAMLMISAAVLIASFGIYVIAQSFVLMASVSDTLLVSAAALSIIILSLTAALAGAAMVGVPAAIGIASAMGILAAGFISFYLASYLFGDSLQDVTALLMSFGYAMENIGNVGLLSEALDIITNVEPSGFNNIIDGMERLSNIINQINMGTIWGVAYAFSALSRFTGDIDFSGMSSFVDSLNAISISRLYAVSAGMNSLADAMYRLAISSFMLDASKSFGAGSEISQTAKVTVDANDANRNSVNHSLNSVIDVLNNIHANAKATLHVNNMMNDKLARIVSALEDPSNSKVAPTDNAVAFGG